MIREFGRPARLPFVPAARRTEPMEAASALFAERVGQAGVPSSDPRYRNALFHLLASQTSCFRYWGEGTWTDYGREIIRRAEAILDRCG